MRLSYEALVRGRSYSTLDERRGVLISTHPKDGSQHVFSQQDETGREIWQFYSCHRNDIDERSIHDD